VVHPAVYDVGGMAAAEALAVGLPGVSFDLPALRAYYPRGFLKAKPGDFQGFADCLYRLLTEPELYKNLSAEAFVAGQEWDWDARAKRILDAIFQRLENLKQSRAAA
jgi:glycosyltransferase involved in cell wall biosynthesis